MRTYHRDQTLNRAAEEVSPLSLLLLHMYARCVNPKHKTVRISQDTSALLPGNAPEAQVLSIGVQALLKVSSAPCFQVGRQDWEREGMVYFLRSMTLRPGVATDIFMDLGSGLKSTGARMHQTVCKLMNILQTQTLPSLLIMSIRIKPGFLDPEYINSKEQMGKTQAWPWHIQLLSTSPYLKVSQTSREACMLQLTSYLQHARINEKQLLLRVKAKGRVK